MIANIALVLDERGSRQEAAAADPARAAGVLLWIQFPRNELQLICCQDSRLLKQAKQTLDFRVFSKIVR